MNLQLRWVMEGSILPLNIMSPINLLHFKMYKFVSFYRWQLTELHYKFHSRYNVHDALHSIPTYRCITLPFRALSCMHSLFNRTAMHSLHDIRKPCNAANCHKQMAIVMSKIARHVPVPYVFRERIYIKMISKKTSKKCGRQTEHLADTTVCE